MPDSPDAMQRAECGYVLTRIRNLRGNTPFIQNAIPVLNLVLWLPMFPSLSFTHILVPEVSKLRIEVAILSWSRTQRTDRDRNRQQEEEPPGNPKRDVDKLVLHAASQAKRHPEERGPHGFCPSEWRFDCEAVRAIPAF